MARMLSSAVRSYFWDLLPLSWPATHSGVVIFVCRLIGCASIVGIVAVSILHGGSISASKVLPFGLLVMTVALPVGNLIKEVTVLIGGVALNWLGFVFLRTRWTLGGAPMSEVYRPDGTWDRYIPETTGTIHEWSDLDGVCRREVRACGAPGGAAFANSG
jgi:hypothetical protein